MTTTSAQDDGADDAQSTADVKDPAEYEQVFKPKNKLSLSPPQKMDPFPAPDDGKELKITLTTILCSSFNLTKSLAW